MDEFGGKEYQYWENRKRQEAYLRYKDLHTITDKDIALIIKGVLLLAIVCVSAALVYFV